ncbi:DEAD/DEAH box helicase [Actinomadura geliboluensis]|uniref:DEAD/DEAH box helicase n=1 Tax=Actinomadura geliboluensis TaxID=882440 RepID=UPI0036C45E34
MEAPLEWIDGLLAAAPAPTGDDDRPILLDLSYDPRRLEPLLKQCRATVRELDTQLEHVIGLDRRTGNKDGPFAFVCHIVTPEFTLVVAPRMGKETLQSMAVIVAVRRRTTLEPRRVPRVHVRRHPLWDEAPCDLEAVLDEFTVRQTRLNDAWNTARDVLGRVTEAAPEDRRLADECERLFAPLEAVFRLRQKHEELTTALRAEGTVVVRPGGRLEGFDDPQAEEEGLTVVLASGDGPPFPEDARVTVSGDGGECGATVASCENGRIRLRPRGPARRAAEVLALGGEVTVTGDTAVIERQQRSALTRFAQRNVIGDWSALARVLCRPHELQGPPPGGDRATPHKRLSVEQAEAARAAINAPHALFIQGPPGTGKSTVIVETIRRLVAEGERVLLVAPMNVAVDEVLRRLGDSALLPIRVAADVEKVRPEVRRFHEDRLRAAVVERLQDDGRDRTGEWTSRLALLTEQAEAVARLDRALDARRAAEKALTDAELLKGAAEQEYARRDAATRQAVEEAEQFAAGLPARLDDASAANRAAQDELARAGAVHEQALAELRRAEKRAGRDRAEADAVTEEEDQQRQQLDGARRDLVAAEYRVESLDRQRDQAAVDLPRLRRLVQAAERDLHLAHQATEGWKRETELAAQRQEEYREQQGWRGRLMSWAAMGEFGRLAAETERARAAWVDAAQRAEEVAKGARRLRTSIDRLERRTAANEEEVPVVLAAIERLRVECRAQSEILGRTARRRTDAAARHAESVAAVEKAMHAFQTAEREKAGAAESLRRTYRDHRALQDTHQQAAAALTTAQERRASVLAELRTAIATSEADCEQKEADLAKARASHEAAAAALNGTEPEADALDREIRRLRSYQRLQERWKELTQAGDQRNRDSVELVTTAVLQAANVVCATVEGIAGRDVSRYADFDTLIVDEASRVTDGAFLVPAVRARRWILVGDERQLPPYVAQEAEHLVHALLALHDHATAGTDLERAVERIGEQWKEEAEQRTFRKTTVLATAQRLLEDGSWGRHYRPALAKELTGLSARLLAAGEREIDPVRELLQSLSRRMVTSLFERCVADPAAAHLRRRLTVQRRMIEPIASLVSEPVYGGAYTSPDERTLRDHGITPLTSETFRTPVVFFDTHRHAAAVEEQDGNGFRNPWEARFIADLCRRWDHELAADPSVTEPVTMSILTFYKAQARLIRREIGQDGFEQLCNPVVNSIDMIQGQESDLVVIDFVRRRKAKPGPAYGLWLQDLNRLNVAVTRARRGLIMVGHAHTLRNLRGRPDAQAFYRHLFASLETRPEMTLAEDAKL